nr:uncharacterized protein LOC117844108 [Setaria viridis]
MVHDGICRLERDARPEVVARLFPLLPRRLPSRRRLRRAPPLPPRNSVRGGGQGERRRALLLLRQVLLLLRQVRVRRRCRRAPFLFWLTGGDRCSVFSGLAHEIGPIRFVLEPYNGTLPRLRCNQNSWSKVLCSFLSTTLCLLLSIILFYVNKDRVIEAPLSV